MSKALQMKSILYLLLIAPLCVNAGSLATELGEAVIGGLKIGSSYNLTETGLPLVVINTSEEEVELVIEPLVPSQIKEGYEPIPDISWVELSKNRFRLKPQERAITDIIIKIPDDPKYISKKYQVNIWSHTIGEAGRVLLGLSSRLLLHIEGEKEPKKEGISLVLIPEKIEIGGVRPGYVKDVKEGFIVENRSKEPVDCILEVLSVNKSYARLEEGYIDTPNPSYLILSEREINLKGFEKKRVSLYVAFPKKKEYGRKNYMFIVHLKGPSLGVYSRVYVKTK